MDDLWAIAVGALIGLPIIWTLNAFPGESFDCEKNQALHRSLEVNDIGGNAEKRGRLSLEAMKDEVDLAASRIKVSKLQELLGLEKEEIQKLIAQAKEDAVHGRQLQSPVNYSRRFDIFFYVVFGVMLVLVLRVEYSIDTVEILVGLFPREAETVRMIVASVSGTFNWK